MVLLSSAYKLANKQTIRDKMPQPSAGEEMHVRAMTVQHSSSRVLSCSSPHRLWWQPLGSFSTPGSDHREGPGVLALAGTLKATEFTQGLWSASRGLN